jgi:hypothetical protein
MTKLWLIRQTKNNGYDTYDSAVVAAPDEETARHIHPNNYSLVHSSDDSWVHPRDVVVEYLGETDREISGVILASFNAG